MPAPRAAAAVAIAVLALAWVWAYRKKRVVWPLEVLTGAVLFVVINAVSDPRGVQPFFFAALMFNGLYGGPVQLAFRLVLVQAAFFSPGNASAFSAIGFTAAGVVVWALGRAMEHQQRLEARFRSLVTNASDMIVVLGAGGKITWQSPAVHKQLGRSLSDGEVTAHERLELKHANGQLREIEALVTDLTADPNVEGIVLNMRDVTDRNRADRELVAAKREVEIAAQIQTALLPRVLQAPGYEVAASMHPAEEVGGDYYDVLPAAGGCFIGIGDVTGHGLNAGLTMLMIQSAIAALVGQRPTASPRELVCALNTVLYDNLKNRLGKADHVTFSLLKLSADGAVTFAGAHEELVVVRKDRVESVQTPGTWLGAMPDIERATVETTLKLERGDVLVLYTDGAIEARNGGGEQFGHERLAARAEALRGKSPSELIAALEADVEKWAVKQSDDVTLLACRYAGP
ncbi:MAG: SpoIIE family protein phosphatase [Myxococcaceae bacterium]|nr:SpoIIE family protein phosphatase [Myxococcaceae bacterium]